MSRTVSSALADLRAGLTEVSGAWAAWREAAYKARLSAVMGPSLSRHLSYSDEYSASDSIRSDPWLRRIVDEATSVFPDLHAAIVSHLDWVVSESRNGLIEDLTRVDPNFTLHVSEAAIDDTVERLRMEHSRVESQLQTKLDAVKAEADALISTRGATGMSKSRMRTIDDHDSQIKFVSAKASQLAFCDRARSEVESAVQSLKDSHGNADGGSRRALYQSDEFSELQAEIKRINTDRNGIELALQAYFDHHSQGASRTESAKIERVQLKLPANLDKGGQAG